MAGFLDKDNSRLAMIYSRLRSTTRLFTCTPVLSTGIYLFERKVVHQRSKAPSADRDIDEGPMLPSSSFSSFPSAFTLPSSTEADPAKLFPHVDEETMNAILRHELPAAELYKLDTRRIQESSWHIVEFQDSAVRVRSVPAAHEIYQTLDSLMVPLNNYFSILSMHALSDGQPITVPHYFFKYSSHLVKIAEQYEWSAVLLYHFAFFARRCSEMLHGNYSGWAKIDVDLMEEILVQHRKSKSRK